MNTNIEVSQINKHFFSKKIIYNESNENDYVKKIILYDFFSVNEIQISDIIEKHIPCYSNYFNILYDYDFIQIGNLDDETIVEKMNINTKEKYLLFEFKKRKFITFHDFLLQSNNPSRFILNTLNTFSYLLHSLIKLYKNNIIFFNLSDKNIAFEINNDKPILIYFDKSLQLQKLNIDYINAIIRMIYYYCCY